MLAFLDAIWGPQGDGVAEVRFLHPEVGVTLAASVSRGFAEWPSAKNSILAVIEDRKKFTNVFFGVVLRDREGGTNEDVKAYTPVLWSDFDVKTFGTRLKTLQAIQRVDLDPQIIVDSGHGYHGYWLLDRPMPIREAQMAMQRLSELFQCDTVGDPARVMRLPGTKNYKDRENPMDVRIVKFDIVSKTRRADFMDMVGKVVYHEDEPFAFAGAAAFPDTQEPIIGAWLGHNPPKGQRSEYIYGLACMMLRHGWEYQAAFESLMVMPAGEKMREMRDPERWFRRTWNAAAKELTNGE